MSAKPWHKRYHADAISGYMGLTLEERGAYSTLLDYLYDRRAPLTGNMRQIAGFLDVSVRKAEAVVHSLIQKGKLILLEDGRLTNARFEKELRTADEERDHKAIIGSRGGRKSAELKKNANENSGDVKQALESRSSSSEARVQKPERKKINNAKLPLSTPGQPGDAPDGAGDAPEAHKRGTRWTADREVPGEWIESANARRVKAGLPAIDLRAVAEEFVTFWAAVPGTRGMKLDWKLTFENRALNRNGPASVVSGRFGAPAAELIEYASVDGWVTRMEIFAGKSDLPAGRWNLKWGPKPTDRGCLVPQTARDIFEERHGSGQGKLFA